VSSNLIPSAIASNSTERRELAPPLLSMVIYDASNGLGTVAPRPATSRSLRVTEVRPLVNGFAASRPLMTGTGLMALMRPHWSATAFSIPSMRPPNAASTSRSQSSSTAALTVSRRREFYALSDFAKHERAQKQILVGDRGVPSRHTRIATTTLSDLENNVGIDQRRVRVVGEAKSSVAMHRARKERQGSVRVELDVRH
jgi:hypothetical protein